MKNKQKLYLMYGIPASGKSTKAASVSKDTGAVIINQDSEKNRNSCELLMESFIQEGISVIIDRCNINIQQRKVWIETARSINPTIQVVVFAMMVSPFNALKRIEKREKHPSVNNKTKNPKKIVYHFWNTKEFPNRKEKIDRIIEIRK